MRTRLALVIVLVACEPKPPPGREAKPAEPATPRKAELPPGHPPVDLSDPKKLLEQVDAMGAELKRRPKSFEVQSALGNLYYDNGRFLEAIDAYREALDMTSKAEESLASARKALGKGKVAACGVDDGAFEALVKAAAGAPAAKAVGCLEQAIAPSHLIRARRGNAFYLIGNAQQATLEHKKALERDPKNGESLFFLGAIVLETAAGDKKKMDEGKALWRRLLEVAPDHPRAELVRQTLPKVDVMFAKADRGGMPEGHPPVGDMPPGHPPVEGGGPAPGAMEAVQAVEKSPELEKGLVSQLAEGEAALEAGKFDDALIAARNVMPLTGQYPELAPRAAVLMGAALRNLKRPMAERVLQQAVQLNPSSGRALYELGALYAESGRKDEARQLWGQVIEKDAAFAAKAGVKEKLAKLEQYH